MLELHGDLREARCTRCDARRALDGAGLPLDEIEHACGGMLRPNIVWFGEPLPRAVWREAEEAAARADVILVVGTSAVVYPAAALATSYNERAFVAEINPEETAISDRVDCVLRVRQVRRCRESSTPSRCLLAKFLRRSRLRPCGAKEPVDRQTARAESRCRSACRSGELQHRVADDAPGDRQERSAS